MTLAIEDYALIGDRHTAALVGRDGSIDWLCLPRFDSPACFAALLGDGENGQWRIAPKGNVRRVSRKYRDGTLILETTFVTSSGTAALIDFMPLRRHAERVDVVRIVRGVRGTVHFESDLALRFAYGSAVPWVRKSEQGLNAISGPDAVSLQSPVSLVGKDFHTTAEFRVAAGEDVPFVLTWRPSTVRPREPLDALKALSETQSHWSDWAAKCTYRGSHGTAVERSLITLRALTYAPTGGIVAAPTTSLPERLGGVRNWDYRYCWLRDATFTLYALLSSGYIEEARAWRDWLLRSCAGRASQMQVMYGVAGERLLPEFDLPWLSGYRNSKPVRVGNAAHSQLQLDVFGEVMDLLHTTRRLGVGPDDAAWDLERELVSQLEAVWDQPDEGIWEVRGPRQHFTHSKVMAWVAMDRAVRGAEMFGLEGPIAQWKSVRQKIHDDITEKAFDTRRQTFVQAYGSERLDAALLLIPQLGFLPPDDPRVLGTLTAIEGGLLRDGFIRRYDTESGDDGLPDGEGAFLACTFWYADALHLAGRQHDAQSVFQRLLAARNDVGLLAEEFDPKTQQPLGNFPQAFSHIGLINTAHNLSSPAGPARSRRSLGTSKERASAQPGALEATELPMRSYVSRAAST